MKVKLIRNIPLITGLATTIVLAMTTSVSAADGKALYTAKGCVACHGVDAKTPIMPAYPKLAGQSKVYADQQMQDIKSGKRNNGQTAVMKGIMAAVSDEEITALADYLSSL